MPTERPATIPSMPTADCSLCRGSYQSRFVFYTGVPPTGPLGMHLVLKQQYQHHALGIEHILGHWGGLSVRRSVVCTCSVYL